MTDAAAPGPQEAGTTPGSDGALTSPTRVEVVVNISLGYSGRDYDQSVDFLGTRFRLLRFGTDGDVRRAEQLLADWRGTADVIAMSSVAEGDTPGRTDPDARALARLMAGADTTAVTDGTALRDVLSEWSIRSAAADQPGIFTNARTLILSGMGNYRAANVLAEFTPNLRFADPVHLAGIPPLLGSLSALDRFARIASGPLHAVPRSLSGPLSAPGRALSRSLVQRAARDSDVIVAEFPDLLDLDTDVLEDKVIITSAVSQHRLEQLRDWKVIAAVDVAPQPFPVTVGVPVLQALMMAVAGPRSGPLTDDDMLDLISAAELQPRLLHPTGRRRKSRFAFVIHPLSQAEFTNVGALSALSKIAPARVMSTVEKAVAYAPPFTYTEVTGIESPSGDKAEGILITVGGTPREMMSHSPEFTYRRLLAAAEIARRSGAQIMGLGAFTKVVGDAGVTVAKRAPLPITTGNSYSASAALWALHEAVSKLGMAEVDEQGRLRGKAMVIGATGSIGSVCARLLALACDELWLVSPESGKLLALKEDIERGKHRAVLHVATAPDGHLGEMDAIVTATSGAGKRVLDIMKVKPGCVITDVARPLDLSASDVAKRPDVMVVESGEISLPGDVHMRDIGLPPGVAYACLAETIVLALEGRYENFTVGRAIEPDKVKQIYQLGRKHGMALATISGANGMFTDADIARIREQATKARALSGAQPD